MTNLKEKGFFMKISNLCIRAAEISTEIEQNNSDLKKEYITNNINLYRDLVSSVDGYRGSIGTGYPFYALKKNLEGKLPVISEQIRYNNELIDIAKKDGNPIWTCASCLYRNASKMPDLKQICKPCPNINNDLKPRKVINRLPDIDLWMVADDEMIKPISEELAALFKEYGFRTSDVDPVQTIIDLIKINQDLKNDKMPTKLLPIDSHIIGYRELLSLIYEVPKTIKESNINNAVPYLPIQPLSYRKDWQYDDMAYNFVHDYLSSFTEYDFDETLQSALDVTRNEVINSYSTDELYDMLLKTGPKSVADRHKTLELRERFYERVESWKR